jgi:glycosyltransferase involved in cell wall biosynthesis
MKVLLELRPALDGHAGIPQETRLLFSTLCRLEGIEAEGLIQSSGHLLARGLPYDDAKIAKLSKDRQINRLSRTVISLQKNFGNRHLAGILMMLWHLLGGKQQLGKFDSTHFQDFVWRAFFARTLPFDDFDTVTRAKFRTARVPWTVMNYAGLITKSCGKAIYPRINTKDFDLMIAETPFPARLSSNTRLVVRYHDAIPVLMPHTISDKRYHQATHYNALKCNVENGAYFACVSDASRRDLISIFPEVEARAVTIPNMISEHYFAEESSSARIPEILRARFNPKFAKLANHSAENVPPEYLLIVSTIEPRKNHTTLLAAWEHLRTTHFPQLKLVIVGMLGWDHKAIVKKFQPWLDRGQLFMLEDVPSPELRILYRHARATVCPSYGEGFDFSGVEAMRCGGAVVASDIAVHREIYDDAAEYFNPYAIEDAAAAIARVLAADSERRQELIQRGQAVSVKYTPENVRPLWADYLRQLPMSR